MKVRPVVAAALDQDALALARKLVDCLSERSLGEEVRYPSSMCRLVQIHAARRGRQTTQSDVGEASEQIGDRLYASTGRVQFTDQLQQIVDATRDSTEWDSLIVTHGVEPDPRPILVLLGCCWNTEMQEHLLRVLDAIHSLPFGRGRSDVFGLMLLPELRLATAADEAVEQRAVTFAGLRTIQAVIDRPEKTAWDGWYALDRVWLVGNNDRTGRGLGGFEDVVEVLGAGLASYIADGALEEQLRRLGTDRREFRDQFDNSLCYQSLGFREFLFPQDRLREYLFKMLLDRSLEGYVGREPEQGSDEFVLQARDFAVNEIAAQRVDQRISGEIRGSKVLSEFAVHNIQAGKVDVFLERLAEEADLYAEQVLNRAKQELGTLSRAEAEALEKACDQLLCETVDVAGPRAAHRLAQELTGEASEPSLEERLSISDIADRYRQQTVDLVGFAPPPQRTAEHVESRIGQVQEEIDDLRDELRQLEEEGPEVEGEVQSLDLEATDERYPEVETEQKESLSPVQSSEARGDDSPAGRPADDARVGQGEGAGEEGEVAVPEPSTQDQSIQDNQAPQAEENGDSGERHHVKGTAEARTWREERNWRNERRRQLRAIQTRLRSLATRLKRLERAKKRVIERVAQSTSFWHDAAVRKRAFGRLEAGNQRSIALTIKRLRDEDEHLNALEREKLEIRDRSRRVLLNLFVIMPIVLSGLVVITSAILHRFYDVPISLQLRHVTENFEFAFAGLATYFVFTAEEFFRLIYLPIVRVNGRIKEATQQCRSLREKCVRKRAEAFNADFRYRVLDRTVQILDRLANGIQLRSKQLSEFLSFCEPRQEQGSSFSAESTPGVDVLISPRDLPTFLSLCFEREIDEEIEEILSGQGDGWRLSSALLSDSPIKGIQTRLAQFFDARFEARIGSLSVDEILAQHWEKLHPPIPPDRRALSVFRLAPFVQLVDLPGESEIGQQYRVSLREGSESRLFQALGVPPHPLSLHPSASRERISVICESDPFSVVCVSKLEVYKEAYDKYLKRNKDAPLHPKGMKEEDLPALVPAR